MKRILLSVFAAAITAAWAVPASAADVTFGGQYRLRGEYRNNLDYDDDAVDDFSFWGQRVRLTANANATDDTSVKITLQDTRILADSDSLISDTTESPDLHEAYLNVSNIFGAPVSFRAGRQELNYGDQRLIGSFGWSNFGRAFDGFKFVYSNDAVDVDAFYMITAEGANVATSTSTGATTFVGSTNDDSHLTGVYATVKQLVPNNTVDLYLLHQGDNAALTRYTLGARVKGSFAGVDYTAELPYQTGEQSETVDIAAWALAIKAGYTLPTPMKIRVGAEYDYGSGDETSADENEAFTDLFPTNHAHFGIADVTGANSWTNLTAWSVNASADLNEKLNVYAAYWNYTLNEVASGASDERGSEIDLVASYKYNNNVGIEAGAARFFPGEATATTPDDPQDFAYLQLTANF